MKSLLALAAVLFGCLPRPALASGFYLPAPVEWLPWLIATPAGWAVLALVAVAAIVGVVKLAKKGDE